MKKTQLQKANEKATKQKAEKYEKLRRIITADGFIQEWYKTIPKCKDATQAFWQLNQFYHDNVIPAAYRYSSYSAFLNQVKRKK